MFIKSLQIGLMGFFLCAANAWAGPASIQGIVKDAKGQPIKGADVRIESRDGKQLFKTVKTDPGSLHFTGAAAWRLPGIVGSEWRSQSVYYEHENQGRSGDSN